MQEQINIRPAERFKNWAKHLLKTIEPHVPFQIETPYFKYGPPIQPVEIRSRKQWWEKPTVGDLALTPEQLDTPFNDSQYNLNQVFGEFEFPDINILKKFYQKSSYEKLPDSDGVRGLLAEIALECAIQPRLDDKLYKPKPYVNCDGVKLSQSKRGPGYIVTSASNIIMAEMDNLLAYNIQDLTGLIVCEVKAGNEIKRKDIVTSFLRKKEALQKLYPNDPVSFALFVTKDTKIPKELNVKNGIDIHTLPYSSSELLLHSFMVLKNPLRFIANSILVQGRVY